MQLCLIAAMSDNRVIGRDGGLPWHLSADLKRFRALTNGHTILMGRKTYDSIGRPLPQRRSIVLTRRKDFDAAGVEVARSFNEALDMAAGDEKLFVIGGASLYELSLPRTKVLYLTRVHAVVEGDVWFPDFEERDWRLVEEQRYEADERNPLPFSFCVYERHHHEHAPSS